MGLGGQRTRHLVHMRQALHHNGRQKSTAADTWFGLVRLYPYPMITALVILQQMYHIYTGFA